MNYSFNMLKGCSICNPVHQKPCHRSASSFVFQTSKFHFCLLTLFYQGEHSLILPLWLSSQAPCFGPVKIWHGYFKSDFHQPQNCKSKSVSLLPLVNKAVLKPCSMLLYKNRLQKHHISPKSHIALTGAVLSATAETLTNPHHILLHTPHSSHSSPALLYLLHYFLAFTFLPVTKVVYCQFFLRRALGGRRERSCLVCSGSVAEQHQRHLLTSQD